MPPLVPATAFARLPYELRSHIWKLAAEPRHITMRTEKIESPPKKKSRRQNILYEATSAPAPAVIHICRESRQHAPYQRAFTAGTDPRWTWVNFELDIFCVSSVYSIQDITSHRSDIQRLQIRTDDDDDWYEAATNFGMLKVLKEFTSLREIRVVLETGDLMWGDVFAEWNPFGYCPQANVTFIDEGSGLVLTGPQLQMVVDWRMVFSFDSEGNPPDMDSLTSEIQYAISGPHLSLAQIHKID